MTIIDLLDEYELKEIDGTSTDCFFWDDVKTIARKVAQEAWFEGMKQGIAFDREDRGNEAAMPRRSFDEWVLSYFGNTE